MPCERSLAEKLEGSPLTFLWLLSDGSREYARARLDQFEIDWPCIFMPWGTTGPVSREWGISEWPTTFIIDQQGIIRYRGNEVALGGDNLVNAVMSLVE